jgi:hypothetical protein
MHSVAAFLRHGTQMRHVSRSQWQPLETLRVRQKRGDRGRRTAMCVVSVYTDYGQSGQTRATTGATGDPEWLSPHGRAVKD